MNADIDELRSQIDETDRQLLQLIERRTQLALTIGQLKGRQSNRFGDFYRPSRETQIIRKILSLHKGDFPASGLIAIWRQIISTALQLQYPYKLAVYEKQPDIDLSHLAQYYFGNATLTSTAKSSVQILAALTSGQAQLGLLPFPPLSSDNEWWLNLHPPFHILGHLKLQSPDGDIQEAFLVGQAVLEDTGQDQSLLAISCNEAISRNSLCNVLKDLGLQPTLLDSREKDGKSHYLIQIDGFIYPEDPVLGKLTAVLPIDVNWLGAYARSIL